MRIPPICIYHNVVPFRDFIVTQQARSLISRIHKIKNEHSLPILTFCVCPVMKDSNHLQLSCLWSNWPAVYDQTDQLSMIKLTVQLLFFDSFFDNSRKSQQTTNQRWTHKIRKKIKSGKKLAIHFFAKEL